MEQLRQQVAAQHRPTKEWKQTQKKTSKKANNQIPPQRLSAPPTPPDPDSLEQRAPVRVLQQHNWMSHHHGQCFGPRHSHIEALQIAEEAMQMPRR